MASAGIARLVSSKYKVKSKPPRHAGPAQGPKEVSAQVVRDIELDAIHRSKDKTVQKYGVSGELNIAACCFILESREEKRQSGTLRQIRL